MQLKVLEVFLRTEWLVQWAMQQRQVFFLQNHYGCYGDGRSHFYKNENDAEIINSIRLHGKGSDKYENIRIGIIQE